MKLSYFLHETKNHHFKHANKPNRINKLTNKCQKQSVPLYALCRERERVTKREKQQQHILTVGIFF